MQTNKFDFSVLDIEVDNQNLEKAQIGCFITYNGQDLDCIIVDDTDHRLVLDLPDQDSIIRVTAKGLADSVKLGSVSFPSSVFINYAEKSTKEVWITLFDDIDDDLYDGTLLENDPENPRIKVSFTRGTKPTKRKKAKTVKTTTTITKTITETKTVITESDLKRFNVETLRADLRTRLAELIDSLRNDQADLEAENKERVTVLAHLETAHAELQGEHDLDIAFFKTLEDLKDEVMQSIGDHRSEIEGQKNDLLNAIKQLDEASKNSQKEKADAQKEKARLTAIVEKPEDLKENGFTQDAKNLRNDNKNLRTKADQTTQNLVSTRDNRNALIKSHSDLVDEFENTVISFHDSLRIVAQTKKSLAFEKAGLQKELEFNDLERDFLRRKLEGGDLDSKSLRDALDRLTLEYRETDEEFNRYLDQLRLNLRNQDFILNDIAKRNKSTTNGISDSANDSKNSTSKVEHIQEEIKRIEEIDYPNKFTDTSSKLRVAEEERKKHQDALEKSTADLEARINTFANDLAGRQKERDSQAKKISDSLNDLQKVTEEINALLKAIDELDNKRFSDGNRDQIHERLSVEREAIENKLKFAKGEQNKIQNELGEAIKTLDEKQKHILEQRRIIESLKKDIEKIKKAIEEVERKIRLADEELERLANDDEIERLQNRADELERRIAQLEAQIGDGVVPEPEPVEVSYKAKRGDLIDEMLAKYIQNCPVPVKRLGGGFYLFGTRKIYAKIMNGKLVIRVGGGYMVIEKFIETYAEQELIKINSILEREGLTSVDQIDLEEYCLNRNRTAYGNTPGEASPGSKNSANMSGSFKKSLTTTGKSPKTVKTSQIVRNA